VHTIGESAALGASGVILWGGYDYSDSKVSSGFPTSILEILQILVFFFNFYFFNINLFILNEANYFTILYWFCHTLT